MTEVARSPGEARPELSKRPTPSMGIFVWLSLIPVALVVILWLYSGWKASFKEYRSGQRSITLRSDLGEIEIVRVTRIGPFNPMAGESILSEWNVLGLGNRHSASNDGNATKKVLSIPYWMVLVVVAILPIITVARAQSRFRRSTPLFDPTVPQV